MALSLSPLPYDSEIKTRCACFSPPVFVAIQIDRCMNRTMSS